jgi:hypothetical protein
MKLYAIPFILTLSSCASAPITTYNPNKLDTSDLVKLTTIQHKELFSNQYSSFIENIWNSDGEELTKRNYLLGRPLKDFSLPAGKYKFKIFCGKGNLIGHLETIYSLEKGKNYLITCEGRFGVSINFAETK